MKMTKEQRGKCVTCGRYLQMDGEGLSCENGCRIQEPSDDHAAEVSALRAMAEDVMLMSDDLGLDTETPEAIISATSDKVRLAVRALLEERATLRAQLEAAKVREQEFERIQAGDAEALLKRDYEIVYLSEVLANAKAQSAGESYWKKRALKAESQLTAQPDGVPCMGECGQEAWAIHYKDAVKQALEELQDREFSGAKRTLEEALRTNTPAASTPPEGKVREFTFEDAKRIVRGAVEVYGGGYSGAEREAFQNGIRTAFNCLDGARMDDTQTGANYRIGEQALAAPAPAPRQVTHVCEGCDMEWHTGKAVTEGHTCKKPPAPACKECGKPSASPVWGVCRDCFDKTTTKGV